VSTNTDRNELGIKILNIEWFPWAVSAVLILLVAHYSLKFRDIPADKYLPAAAWSRACIYFCCCYLFAWFSGALPAALSGPIATQEQLTNPIWRAWVFGLFVLVTIGYWVIWRRFTIHFERKLELLPQVFFGLIWGLAAGFLFLSFWHLVQTVAPSLPVWAIWLITYLLISVWQWLFQDYGWDVYISPEHDCPWSIAVKVPATHIPNVTFCLIFFAIYGNYWIFVALQTWALIGASVAMRMPSPWSTDETPPARRVPGLFGQDRARAAGYDAADKRNDIYLRSTGLPAGTAIWVLGAHLFSALCPLLMLAVVQMNSAHLESLMYAPGLLYVAALLMIIGGTFEIAQNSFEHHWYFSGGKPGYMDTVFGSLACLAMATMITACYGQSTWLVLLVYGLALTYPLSYLFEVGRGITRALLGIGMVVAMYYCLGDPVVFLSFNSVLLTVYFHQLLSRTRAQAFHGFMVSVSGFGMLTIPWAIHNSAQDLHIGPWKIFVATGLLLVTALALWPRLQRMQATPNAHSEGLDGGSHRATQVRESASKA